MIANKLQFWILKIKNLINLNYGCIYNKRFLSVSYLISVLENILYFITMDVIRRIKKEIIQPLN